LHADALGDEECALQGLGSTVAAEPPARRDDSMTRNIGSAALAHDVPDGTRGSWLARHRRHISVGRHSSGGNPPNGREHPILEP
jgi:hypothetical protein